MSANQQKAPLHHDNPKNYFVILTAGRTGSSFLVSALRSHPDIACFGEILEVMEGSEEKELKDKGVWIRGKNKAELSQHYISDSLFKKEKPPWYPAVGFKIKYYHFDDPGLEEYFKNFGVRILHNKRKNLITQAISYFLALNHEFSLYRSDYNEEGVYKKRTTIDIAEFLEVIEENQAYEAYYEKTFAGSVPVLDIYYDTLCTSDESGILVNQKEVDRILDFLGVSSCQLRTDMLQQRKKPYAELIGNYDVLRKQVLRKHPEWEKHFLEIEYGGSRI